MEHRIGSILFQLTPQNDDIRDHIWRMINEGPFDVVVQCVSGRSVTIRLPHGWYLVGALKRMLEPMELIDFEPISKQDLIYNSQTLQNDKYLMEYGIGVGGQMCLLHFRVSILAPVYTAPPRRRSPEIGIYPREEVEGRRPTEREDVELYHITVRHCTRRAMDGGFFVDPQWTWQEFMTWKVIPHYMRTYEYVFFRELYHFGPREWPHVSVDLNEQIGATELVDGSIEVFALWCMNYYPPALRRWILGADKLPTREA